MGKSNKFDYTNRTNSGAKLGVIIGRDLEKEASKVVKEADRHASKARKTSISSIDSIIGGSDNRDGVAHTLDIKVPGKRLTDEGACALADGLESALTQGTNEASVLLEDLNLAGNAITTVTLARLAPIMILARHDLKTLNLANNCITVNTAEESKQWEAFLRAFGGCFKLRKLDLSGNVSLGARGIEVMARVYGNEADIMPLALGGEASVDSLASTTDYYEEDTASISRGRDPTADGRVLKRRCGLRSIPYITLNDIGLTDAGALWLSYMLEIHHYPSQLIDELNATGADSAVKTYQQATTTNGIDWSDRAPGLTRDGKSLLEKAERIRHQTILADQITIAASDSIDDASIGNDDNVTRSSTRRSIDYRYARTTHGGRRSSVRSIHTNDGGEHELSELESVRKKIQRSTIEQHGVSSVELWDSALRFFSAARLLSGLGPIVRSLYLGPPLFDCSSSFTRLPDEKETPRPVTPFKLRLENTHVANNSNSGARACRQGTYASKLTENTNAIAGEPEQALTDVTNSPTTPKVIFKSQRRGASSDGGDLLVQKLEGARWPQRLPEQHNSEPSAPCYRLANCL